MKFSVVIPTYHRNEDLAKCLDCLAPGKQRGGVIVDDDDLTDGKTSPSEDSAQASQSKPAEANPTADAEPFRYEVIVSDDGRESTAEAIMAERFPWARWVQGPQRGPAANRNNGAKQAKGEWLVFTDDDCLPQAKWLKAYFDNSSETNVLEGKTIADRPRQRLDEEAPTNETGGYLWSCNFAIRKILFHRIKGFDESFPDAAMEDVEFRTRLTDHHVELHFVEKALVVHPYRKTRSNKLVKLRHLSYLNFKDLRGEKITRKDAYAYFFRGFRSMIKVTIPGCIKYKGRGFTVALRHDLFYLFLGVKTLIKPYGPKRRNSHFLSG